MMQRIEGEHILLRKARMDDLDAVYENVYSDAALLSTMFLRISPTREAAEQRLHRTIEFQRDRMVYFVARRNTDEVIGLAGIEPEGEGCYTETGIAIARKYQRRGYGREVLAMLLSLAFDTLGAKQFAYSCISTNLPSQRLAQSFGFQFESSSYAVRDYDSREFQLERYILSREEYEALR